MTDQYRTKDVLVLHHHEVYVTRDGDVAVILHGTVAGQPREIAACVMDSVEAASLVEALGVALADLRREVVR